MSLDSQPPAAGPQVGADEWVAREAHRREYLPSWMGDAQRRFERIGWWPRLAIVGLAAAALPLIGLGGFQLQVGIDTLVIVLLALGLNIVVGWAGLLDLGYVAFFGFGAYGFALLSSAQIGSSGIHLPAYLSVPIVMVGAAILGLLVGWPSRRLIGDYLAIVTLFFGEAFVEFTNNVAPGVLGGPNGIVGIDPIRGFGLQITSNTGYYYLLVILAVVTMAVLRLLDTSRTGRAWRAVREDPLAAASMTIPVNRVKLMAFSFGAVVAALAGTIFAAQQISVFPTDFDTPILILIYAGLILGGAGSIAGAAAGAVVVMVIYDGLLRSPTDSGYLFYGLILLTLVVKLRPWRRLAAVLAATVALGFAAHAIAAGHLGQRRGGRAAVDRLARRRAAGLGGHPGQFHGAGELGIRSAGVPADRAGAGQGPLADHPAGADALPGLVRLGDRAERPARGHPAAHDRRDPDRDDDRPAAGAARVAARRGPDMTTAAVARPGSRAPVAVLRRPAGPVRARPAGGRPGDRQPDRAQRRGQDHGLQRDHRHLPAERRATSGSPAQPIAGLAPHKIARLGIARTFQSLRLFLNMSVIENVMAATYGHTKAMPWESILRLPRARREEREVRALAEDVLSFFGQRLAGYRWDQPAYSLSYANRRRLEIARALGTRPRLLLLDEPAAGMNPTETHEITELIGQLRDERGVSILVIEHDMHVVAGCSDRVIALDHGVKIAEGGFDEVASHPAVVEAYMGRDPEALADAGAAGEPARGSA